VGPRPALRFITNTVAASAGYPLRFARALLLTEVCAESPSHEHMVMEAFRVVYEHEAEVRERQLSALDCLIYPQTYSGPILDMLKQWLEQKPLSD
jgi:hypothetical protein